MIKVIFILLFSSSLFAEGIIPAPEEEDSAASVTENQSDGVDQFLEDPGIAPIYQKCESEAKIPGKPTAEDCLWGAIKGKPALEKILKEKLNKAAESTGAKYDSLSLSPLSQKQDELLTKFSKKWGEKLIEDIFQDSKKERRIVETRLFYKLYKNQLSKNLIRAMSAYCFDVGVQGKPVSGSSGPTAWYTRYDDPDHLLGMRKENFSLTTEFTDELDKNGNATGERISKAYKHWAACIGVQEKNCTPDDPSTSSSDPSIGYKVLICKDPADCTLGEKEEISTRWKSSCEFLSYLRSSRQNILAMEKLNNYFNYKGDQKEKGATKFQSLDNFKVYSGAGNGSDKSIEELTTFTSGELVDKEMGLEEREKELQKQIEECKKSPNDQNCQKLFTKQVDFEKQKKLLLEYELRERARQLEMKESLTKNKEELIKFLIEEGRSEKDAKAMVPNLTPQEIEKLIVKRYDNEKNAVVASLRKEIDKKEKKGDQYDQSAIAAMSEEVTDKKEYLKALTFFNNMVSGFLSFEDADGKNRKKNTAVIFKELENSAYNKDKIKANLNQGTNTQNPGPNRAIADNALALEDTLKGQLEANNIQNIKSETDNTELTVDTINDAILNYQGQLPSTP